jgi:hypothetical protein
MLNPGPHTGSVTLILADFAMTLEQVEHFIKTTMMNFMSSYQNGVWANLVESAEPHTINFIFKQKKNTISFGKNGYECR